MSDIGSGGFFRKSFQWLLRWRHPFWWLPDVPSEQDESYRRIWSQLRQIDSVSDGRHDTEDFLNRRGDLVVLCARVPAEVLIPEFQALQQTLAALPYARIVPESTFNITVQELGYLSPRPNGRDEITEQWLQEYLEQCHLSLKDFRPFDVKLGGVNSYADAAFLDIRDNGWFSRIHEVLVDFVSQPPRTRYPYLPELIVAQYIADAPLGTLVHDLTPYRDMEFGDFRVEQIDVIRIPTTEPFAAQQVVQSYPLGRLTGFMDRVTSAEAGERQGLPSGALASRSAPEET